MPELNILDIEKKWLKYWEKEKIYKFDQNSKKELLYYFDKLRTIYNKGGSGCFGLVA
mgnify:CR=1 FL=1